MTTGTVVSDKNRLTVIVERPELTYISKYKRYARSHSRIAAHNPASMGAALGDIVQIAECRRVSKTKAWEVTQIIRKAGEAEAVAAARIERKREERLRKRPKPEEQKGEQGERK